MPKDVPLANQVESIACGADMTLVDGSISDCARIVGERKKDEGWFDLSTLKEPFRVEGKRPWASNWSSNSDGSPRMPSSIQPAGVLVSSACGRRLKRWKKLDG
jgi:hypothetical protein